jgi:hypothetical protein
LLAEDHPFAVFAGTTDPLFRINEYRNALARVGAEDLLHEIEGSHANLNNRGGRQQLVVIADWVKSERDKRSKSRVA